MSGGNLSQATTGASSCSDRRSERRRALWWIGSDDAGGIHRGGMGGRGSCEAYEQTIFTGPQEPHLSAGILEPGGPVIRSSRERYCQGALWHALLWGLQRLIVAVAEWMLSTVHFVQLVAKTVVPGDALRAPKNGDLSAVELNLNEKENSCRAHAERYR